MKKDTYKQPEVNIGLVGHVDHGKTTLTERLSGKWTDTHSEELKKGITIRLGYANTIFRKCGKCKGAKAYTVKETCEHCKSKTKELRGVSFVDAPGHESLMATMLSGANVMDGALLLISANEKCPQPQTREHLMALEIMGIKNVIIVQNKIDLVSKEDVLKNYKEIKELIKDTPYKDAPIIPISAQFAINIGYLIKSIEEKIPTPKRDKKKPPIMFVVRSFDINKPGSGPKKLVGGVLGGALREGILKKGDDITILPGRSKEEHNQKIWIPIKTKVTGLMSGTHQINEAGPGGSIAIATSLDPSLVKSDNLSGNIVGLFGKLPIVWNELKLKSNLLKRVVGTKEELDVEPIKINEIIMFNVNSSVTAGVVSELSKGGFKSKLKLPICADIGDRVTISRMVGSRFRLIGYGIIEG
ncbi:translation initiation factor IF-2 subunit gamma [Candidatus Woesearchaeota archaeon]|nr:translation initiation factor IF-2 subunit gamma [Candidatus Woesearchaeota archaeon]